jgi:hypothetical protein
MPPEISEKTNLHQTNNALNKSPLWPTIKSLREMENKDFRRF